MTTRTRTSTAKILTANELLSGAVVYLDEHGNWVGDAKAAWLFEVGQSVELDAALAKARSAVNLISVELEDARLERGAIIARRLRERIRAGGPTAPRMAPQSVQAPKTVQAPKSVHTPHGDLAPQSVERIHVSL